MREGEEGRGGSYLGQISCRGEPVPAASGHSAECSPSQYQSSGECHLQERHH